MNQTAGGSSPTTAAKLNEIMASLSDESNVQAVVYSLFERADPEEVKKTVEALQRTLEVKHEEVKKSLSANHEHLFSCTDLVEQMRDYTKISGEHLQKIRTLKDKMENAKNVVSEKAYESLHLTSTYEISDFLFVEESLRFIIEAVPKHCRLAHAGFKSVIDYTSNSNIFSNSLRSFWHRLWTKICTLLKASFKHGRELTQEFIDLMFAAFSQCFEKAQKGQSCFSKIQAINIFCKQFGMSIPATLGPAVIEAPENTFVVLFESLLNHWINSEEEIDIIENIKFVSLLDQRSVLTFSNGSSTPKEILGNIFNLALGHCQDIEVDVYKLESTILINGIKLSLASQEPSSAIFVKIYQQHVKNLFSKISLYGEDKRSHFVNDTEKMVIQVPKISFRFEFMKRYFYNKSLVDKYESSSGTPEEDKLGNLIKSNWKAYCQQAVEILSQNLDIQKKIEDMPESFKNKQESLEYLNLITDAIKQSMSSIEALVDLKQVECEISLNDNFYNSAPETLGQLFNKNITKLLEYENLTGEPSIEELGYAIRRLFVAYFVGNDSKIKLKTDYDFLALVVQAIAIVCQSARWDIILEILEAEFTYLHLDHSDEMVANFIDMVKICLPENALSQDPLAYPHLIPFILTPRLLSLTSTNSKPIVYSTWKIDDLAHEEFLASLA